MSEAQKQVVKRSVTPHLVVTGAPEAIAFYAEAFGAVEQFRMPSPDGKIWHATLIFGDSEVMLCEEFPSPCNCSPTTLGGTPVTLHLNVDDADASFDRAIAAGAAVIMPPGDMFWGDRYAQVVDPFGHRWSLASRLSPEAAARAHAAFEESRAEPQPA